MSDLSGQYQKLPPGWDCKYDQNTGSCYYVNYFTKVMQLEDPRTRYKQLQNERSSTESIPMQQMHGGGSPYHVYPSNIPPMVRAFQTPNTSLNNMSTTPLLSSRAQLHEFSPLPFLKSATPSQTPPMGNMARRSTIQETSFTNPNDTDAVVAKMQNMFPTASEHHIRLLLKKYYNREAVVISALQVEKHPVTMPGPYVTPPAQRHLFHSNSAFQMTPPARRIGNFNFNTANSTRTISPIPSGRYGSVMSVQSGKVTEVPGYAVGSAAVPLPIFHSSPRFGEQWRSSPKPHSSPKMKLRYMKNIFPKADETLLLDILANSDNNVQKASETLISMGYTKRDVMAAKVNTRPNLEGTGKKPGDEQIIPLRPKEYTPEEKEAMEGLLKEKYPHIPEKIILMALESVNYAEDRAIQILQIVQDEEDERLKKQQNEKIAHEMKTKMSLIDETDLSDIKNTDDNILTVVVEAVDSTNDSTINDNINKKSLTNKKDFDTKKLTKYKIPSINVTTPTTATTQIILSNSPISPIVNENLSFTQNDKKLMNNCISSSSIILNSSPSSSVMEPPLSAYISESEPKISSTNSYTKSSSAMLSSFSTLPSSRKTFPTITTKSILARSAFGNTTSGVNLGYLHGNRFSTSSSVSTSATSFLDKLITSRSRDKYDSLKHSHREGINENVETKQSEEFQSLLGRMKTMGHDNSLRNGPDDNLLLADYITWNGANPDISYGHKQSNVNGPDQSLRTERSYQPLGRNPELCKGPNSALAKGSIYAQLSATASTSKGPNIKCN